MSIKAKLRSSGVSYTNYGEDLKLGHLGLDVSRKRKKGNICGILTGGVGYILVLLVI